MKIYLETLGCAKNQVDAEIMSRLLRDRGYIMAFDISECDIAVLNTCGFIHAAKQEAIDRIIDLADLKKNGDLAGLVVTGCLSERYAKDIYREFPEVDLALGVSEYGQIADRLDAMQAGTAVKTLPQKGDTIAHLRVTHESESPYYAYLKIAEGCDAHCTYCAIPGIRGPQRSRPVNDICMEARQHIHAGRKELIIIAQDIALYGKDLYGEPRLATLIRALDDLDGDYRLRLLYAYAHNLTEEVIAAMARARHLVPYLDLPIQHMSPAVLKRMGRRETPFSILDTVKRLRLAMPKITLRSTVMVGFPGESARDIATLRLGLEQLKFERLGCFIYSPEEGTPAYLLPDRVDPELSAARYERIMSDQAARMAKWHASQVGTVRRVLLENVSEDGLAFLGRSESEAPDVDPEILVYAKSAHIELGMVVPVTIVEADQHGMTGVTAYEPAQ